MSVKRDVTTVTSTSTLRVTEGGGILEVPLLPLNPLSTSPPSMPQDKQRDTCKNLERRAWNDRVYYSSHRPSHNYCSR